MSRIFILSLLFHFIPRANAQWDERFGFPGGVYPMVNGKVSAFASSATGMFIGGTFDTVGGLPHTAGSLSVSNIALWNGRGWTALGTGLSEPMSGSSVSVNAIAVDGTNVYVGGNFKRAGGVLVNGIARWDGQSWHALGNGVSGGTTPAVNAITVHGGSVYVGGSFATAGGVKANAVARWDGANWSSIANNTILSGALDAIHVHNGELFIGGSLIVLDGPNLILYLARLNGNSWGALGTGVASQVRALASMGGDLIVGVTGGTGPRIARWNGTSWSFFDSGVSTGVTDGVHAIAVEGETLYVTGYFTTAGGEPANAIAKWEAGAWSALQDGISSPIGNTFFRGRGDALAIHEGRLYVGGAFSRAGPLSIQNVAMWDGANWLPLGAGISGSVLAIQQSGTNVYVGGIFDTAGAVIANSIARWDGTRFHALSNGVSSGVIAGQVHAIAVHGANVYVGGVFTSAGGVSAINVARWNGEGWSALGGGLTGNNAVVRGLVPDDAGNLYATGFFTSAGGVPVSGIARWNGSAWFDVGEGLHADGAPGEGRALLILDDDLYVGGAFNRVGNVSITGLARWNGGTWSSVGSGVNATVLALAKDDEYLYAGGYFTNAGGLNVNRIAQWDGSKWEKLGDGLGESPAEFVAAISALNGKVYAGGVFTNASGVLANHLAVWDGDEWKSMNGGTAAGSPPAVYALAATPQNIYVGGTFQSLGGIPSLGIGAWRLQTATRPALSIEISGSALNMKWTSEPGATYQIMATPRLNEPFQNLGDPIVSTGTTTSVELPIEGESGFFALEKVEE